MSAGDSCLLRQPSQYIVELESLRGWAILLVLAFHYFGILLSAENPLKYALGPMAPIWLQVVAAGNTGVTLFFVLSGFLLSRPFLDALKTGRAVSIRRFYIARVFRILPLYYFFILLAWWVTGNTAGALKAAGFFYVGFSLFPFSVPWWSLSTEVQFYLLLPWLMLLLHFRMGRWLVIVVVLSWLAVHFYYFHQRGWLGALKTWSLQASLFGRGPAFLVGVICAWIYMGRTYARFALRQGLVASLLVALLWALYELLSWYAQQGQLPAKKAMPMYHNIEALLWGGILLCCVVLRSRVRVLLINPLLNHLGVLSYSFYLVHVPVQFYAINWFKAQGGAVFGVSGEAGVVLIIVLSFMATWLLSMATYHGLEKPCLKLKARLSTYADQRATSGVALEK
ncbi:acyltransferase [Pseudomonas sp. WS 5013]|uniref:acyltransferase family protein n=1 Tax=Pseudomonas sp. WS 5013 TaxID=2717475 RepID=UPI001474AB15|nr:acyltransferase [Pseudomonas sp. WS 5013]NMY42784.1 acyltransferase [Pseudomonas sp. WS 5013]